MNSMPMRMRGLSPRTRGNLDHHAREEHGEGPIPADAGEPRFRATRNDTTRAYPRGRGGTVPADWQHPKNEGLSPRTRGNLSNPLVQSAAPGPIPADAGEPARPSSKMTLPRAYPRGRGGTEIHRMMRTLDGGLSPRTRGNLNPVGVDRVPTGPIPADAGEPGYAGRSAAPNRAYPRGRGGTASASRLMNRVPGLSPRTRGNHPPRFCSALFLGPIPADAGEPFSMSNLFSTFGAYPRGRGGTLSPTPCQ